MIAISCVIEEKGLFKNIEESNLKELLSNASIDIHFDKFDFDNNTFIDFVDYLDFQEYQKYIFFVSGSLERIYKLVEFLEKEIEGTDFYIVNDNLEVKHGNFELLDVLQPLKGQFQLDQGKVEMTHLLYLRNGLMSLFSGVYPHNMNKKTLKHLYIENGTILKNINAEIYYNMAINSSVFIDESSEEIELKVDYLKELPNIILLNNTLASFQKEDLISIEKDELDVLINKFKQTSVVENMQNKEAIFDYANLTETSTNNRLFFFSDGIFNDYLKGSLVSRNINLSYFDILSKYKVNNGEQDKYDSVIKGMLPLMFNLASSFQGCETTFVTPYTKNKLDPLVDTIVEFKLIGIKNNTGCFVYNIQTNKIFETNEMFLEILEADQKSNQGFLKERFKEQYDEILNEYKELVGNV
ncbi:hypothetical protein EXW32_22425 [Bacillus mycoides]|uniref:hypothetical protein n=1 Tax=Bacillus mycoides TaxID=1405 RepID=UPI001C029E72|nr:hypothetical protein [Bacillus mycoides]QWG69102.1 hypothetical protein EXW32_22425 [Bacillus mycoides]